MENINNCNICKSYDATTLHNENGFIYSICKSCGHVYQSDRSSKEFYLSLPYTVAQVKVTNVRPLAYDIHANNRGTYIYDFIKDYIKPLNCNSILDIGSGFGGVTYYLGKLIKAKKILGVTPDYNSKTFTQYDGIDFIKSAYGTSVKGHYDLIIMSHVLEHFISPIVALKNARKNISNHGLLYIEVPSFQWEGIRHQPIFTPIHLSYFSKKSLENIIEHAGFRIVKMKESKYWGSIKIVAVSSDLKNQIVKNKENWIFKIITWKLKKYFVYCIIKLCGKFMNIKHND